MQPGSNRSPPSNSLLAGNLAGNFLKKRLRGRFSNLKRGQHQSLMIKFPAQRSREFFCKSREFYRGSREFCVWRPVRALPKGGIATPLHRDLNGGFQQTKVLPLPWNFNDKEKVHGCRSLVTALRPAPANLSHQAVGRRAVAMTEDDKGLFSGGYCYSLRNSGPSKIGKDFEAPAPEGGVLPRISIEQRIKDELWSFVASRANIKADENSEAGIFYDSVKRLDFENGVSEALNWYMSDHHHQAEIPAFRKQLQTLRKAIEQFKLELPSESWDISCLKLSQAKSCCR